MEKRDIKSLIFISVLFTVSVMAITLREGGLPGVPQLLGDKA